MTENNNSNLEPKTENTNPVEPEIKVMDAETIEPITNKKSKNHPIIKYTLIGALCLGAGFGGSYIENQVFPHNTVIYQATSTDSSNIVQTSSETNLENIIAAASKSVVEIESSVQSESSFFGQTVEATSAGSGVIISTDGYIVTNNHVVEDATSVSVTLSDGATYDAEIIGTDSRTDLAVIKIDATGLTPATFADSDELAVGKTAIAIGNPLGTLGGTVTDGIVSAIDREITVGNETMTLIQTNAQVSPGNSGGGLFDDSGNLIGIVNSKDVSTEVEGIGFAIPSNTVKHIATQLIDNGYVADRAALGVYIAEITQGDELYSAGVYIKDFIDGSCAEEAGLKVYDKIVSFDGTEINSYSDLSSALLKATAGDTVEITVERQKEELTFDVTLQEYQPATTETTTTTE